MKRQNKKNKIKQNKKVYILILATLTDKFENDRMEHGAMWAAENEKTFRKPS